MFEYRNEPKIYPKVRSSVTRTVVILLVVVTLTAGTVFLRNGASYASKDSNLEPLTQRSMRSVSGAEGIQLRFNLDIFKGNSGNILRIHDANDGGELDVGRFELQLTIGEFSSEGLEINALDDTTDHINVLLPSSTDITNIKIATSELDICDRAAGNCPDSSTDLGGLYIGCKSCDGGNPGAADLGATGNFRFFGASD